MAVTLAIESSQREGSVALRLDNGDVVEEAVRPASYGDDLMAAIARLCAMHGVRPRSIGSVVVDRGPGGFTGLRVGVSAAKFIAECAGATLVGVPGVLVAAAGDAVLASKPELGRVLAVLAVKRRDSASSQAGTAWCAVIQRSSGDWAMEPPGPQGRVMPLADLVPLAAEPGIDAILAEEAHNAELRSIAGNSGIPWIEPRWSARACLSIGARWLESGVRDDAATLQPIYAREAEAVARWEAIRGHSRGGT